MNMKRCIRHLLAACVLVLAGTAGPQPASAAETCLDCHGEQGRQLQLGVHGDAAITCTGCHGGDPAAGVKEVAHGAGFRGRIGVREAVELCGGCHADSERMRPFGLKTDQLEQYKTSPHGRKLFESGDTAVASCVHCHGAHEVLHVRGPLSPVHKLNQPATCGKCHSDAQLMARSGLSAAGPAEYQQSVHGIALLQERNLASPACADCHGSHGAAPPGVLDVSKVCGHCHTVTRRAFESSPHLRAAQAGAMQECTACHGVHAIRKPDVSLFQGTETGHCGSCHDAGPAAATAKSMHDGISSLHAEIAEARRLILEASARGVFLEEEQGYLEEASAMLVRIGPASHSASGEQVGDLLNRGRAMVHETLESLEVKSRWLRDRKFITVGFALVIAVFVGVLLIRRGEV